MSSSQSQPGSGEHPIIEFFKGVRSELQKVTWPPRQKVINDTIIVIVGSLIMALFLGSLDFLFTFLLERFVA
jgi:preprotein translocase subunit SecE